jgi:hypothetical protein
MVYKFGISSRGFFEMTSDKPRSVLDVTPDLTPECSKGMEMVKRGVKMLVKSETFESVPIHDFTFNAIECGCAMHSGEWELLMLALLKRNGYISLDSKAVFTIARLKLRIGENPEIIEDGICRVVIAQEGEKFYYALHNLFLVLHVIRAILPGGPKISLEGIEDITKDSHDGGTGVKHTQISHFTARMDVVDFGSMIAGRDVLSRQGDDTVEKVKATLMGTHSRLGEGSPLYGLDTGIMQMIVGNILSPVMREAVEAGVVRL